MLLRVGEIEVWRILEIDAPFLSPEEMFPGVGPSIRALMERVEPGLICALTGRVILPVQGFLLKTPSHVVLVDSCVGNDKTVTVFPDWHKRSDTRFMASLNAAGIGPQDVDYVLCTHLHVDHVGWNTQLLDGRWVPTFPKARYLMPAVDNEVFQSSGEDFYGESVLPVIEAGQAELIGPDHQLGDHVTLVPTPGHTPGHVSVLLQSGGSRAVITGDALHTTAQCHFPDWEFVYDMEAPQAVQSRRFLLESAAEELWTVLGTHFTLPSIGKVRSEKGAFCWCPAHAGPSLNN